MDRHIFVFVLLVSGCSFPRGGPLPPDPAQGMLQGGQAPHLADLRNSDRRIVYGPRPLRIVAMPPPGPPKRRRVTARDAALIGARIFLEILGAVVANENRSNEEACGG